MEISFYEIYNEKIHDLLSSSSKKKKKTTVRVERKEENVKERSFSLASRSRASCFGTVRGRFEPVGPAGGDRFSKFQLHFQIRGDVKRGNSEMD